LARHDDSHSFLASQTARTQWSLTNVLQIRKNHLNRTFIKITFHCHLLSEENESARLITESTLKRREEALSSLAPRQSSSLHNENSLCEIQIHIEKSIEISTTIVVSLVPANDKRQTVNDEPLRARGTASLRAPENAMGLRPPWLTLRARARKPWRYSYSVG